MDQRPQLRAPGHTTATRPGTWGFWSCCAALSAQRCFTSSTSGATSRPIPARSSASTRCRQAEFFPADCWPHLSPRPGMCGRHHMPALGTCDAFAPGLALGHAIGRIGCFAAGCCYGKETHHWWGVVFHNPLANSITGTPLNIPLEPTQLFEVGGGVREFLLPHVAAEAQKVRRPGLWRVPVHLRRRADSSWNICATIPAADRSSVAR